MSADDGTDQENSRLLDNSDEAAEDTTITAATEVEDVDHGGGDDETEAPVQDANDSGREESGHAVAKAAGTAEASSTENDGVDPANADDSNEDADKSAHNTEDPEDTETTAVMSTAPKSDAEEISENPREVELSPESHDETAVSTPSDVPVHTNESPSAESGPTVTTNAAVTPSMNEGGEQEQQQEGKEEANNEVGGTIAPSAANDQTSLNTLRGPHAKGNNTELNIMDLPKASGMAKDRTKGSQTLDTEHRLPPPLQQQPSTHSFSDVHSERCNLLSLQCHANKAFSAHPILSCVVVLTFVLLLLRRCRHRHSNNTQSRMDGRGEYAAIELLEGNFDDEMSFTGDVDMDDDDPDDIVANSWKGPQGNRALASGVGDDLDDALSDGQLSLEEMNG